MSDIRTLVDGVRAAWNNHDAPGFAAQFSEDAVLRIIATGDVLHGREQLRAVAEAYLHAFPDLQLERRRTYECGEAVCIIETTLTATHEGEFMGIPPTHRLVELLTCSIFTLGADQRLGGEVLYFDAATLLRQLGVFPKSADAEPTSEVIRRFKPPSVAGEPANEGDSEDARADRTGGVASADGAVSAGNRQVRVNIFAPRTGQAAQEQLVVVQRIIEETDPTTHSDHKAPLSKQPGPLEKAAADSTGDQVWKPIEKCWWVTPQDYQDLADCAGWVKRVETSWHDLVLVEPAQRAALGAGFPPESADVIGLIAGKVSLPGDNAFQDARRLFLCTGIVFGVVSGAAPIANACFSSLAHDLLVEATAKAFRAAIDQALPPTSDARVRDLAVADYYSNLVAAKLSMHDLDEREERARQQDYGRQAYGEFDASGEFDADGR